MPPIHYHGTVSQLRQTIRSAVEQIAGKRPDQTGLVENLLLRVGMTALSLIKDAYTEKSRGGTDEAGIKWAPLSPKTIAYGRRHPGLTKIRKRAAEKGRVGRPLLSEAQDARWRQLYSRALHGLSKQAGINGPATADIKGHAAAYAWDMVKSEGGKTILKEYGGTEVEILVDTAVLVNSLSPGLPGQKPTNADQILRTEPGVVMVGTNVPYAAVHHYGSSKRNIPKRPLWPDADQWPQRWRDEETEQVREGGRQLVLELVRRDVA